MKKIIIKIMTILLAFFAGIAYMGFFYNKGNLDMTAHMAEASLPVLYFTYHETPVHPIYGYTSDIDPSCVRDGILPLDEDRTLQFVLETYHTKPEAVSYEVRSTDMERLIQDGEIENLTRSDQSMKGSLKIKDLLADEEEYLLIIHVKLDQQEDVKYITRVRNSSYELVDQCVQFAMDFHNATLDTDNDYPITQYLETDRGKQENSLAVVDIHSRYKNVIWGGMNVIRTKEPVLTFESIEEDVVSLRLSYEVSREAENGGTEAYEVMDHYRVRCTDLRMYLLDYERTTERIFHAETDLFGEQSIELGIQWKDIEYRSNEEGSVVNFVVSGELWSYDVAQNKLSRVFSFKNGEDQRGLHDDFEIRIINMEDSGSMDFIVTGYMNRGSHEGETGALVMHYDSLTNVTEELLFIRSSQCADVLSQTVGELLYVSQDDRLYLSYGANIYAIDLSTRQVELLTEELEADNYVISREGDRIAWRYGSDRYASSKITTMDMKTGIQKTYEAPEGELLRPLGFSGEDFLYGLCRESDVYEDFAENTLFPMYQVRISDHQGEMIRSFDYSSKNKYVISADVENNRINLTCVEKTADGTYGETLAEAITSNEQEKTQGIVLTEVKDDVKKLEKVLKFEIKAEGKRKEITPKQLLFEESRELSLEEEGVKVYHAYGRGRLQGVFAELRQAVMAAYDSMGIVMDENGRILWQRSGRKTRSVSELSQGCEPVGTDDPAEAGIRLLLERQGVYVQVAQLLENGSSPYEILKENSKEAVENLTGCNLSSVLYYVNKGDDVLGMTDAHQAWIITGYDAQNVYLLDASTGQVTRMGQKDAAAMFENSGNVFFGLITLQ